MDDKDSRFFSVRKQTDDHTSNIHHSVTRDREFQDLVTSVFSHQRAIFAPNTGDHFGAAAPPDKLPAVTPTPSYIAATFYLNKEFYSQDFLIKTGGPTGAPISVNAFLDHILSPRSSDWRNKIFFLTGEVGCGKSTFINHIITSHGLSWVQDKRTWFIRTDVDITAGFEDETYTRFCSSLRDQVVKVIGKNSDVLRHPGTSNQYEKLKNARLETDIQIEDALREFFTVYSSITGRQLFLIIDNLDYLYHLNDRDLFTRGAGAAQTRLMSVISRILYRFYGASDSPLSLIGAKILFVMRPDSYRILESATFGDRFSNSPFEGDDGLFFLTQPDWMTVVSGRCALLEHVIRLLGPEKQKDARSVISRLKADLEKTASDSTATETVLDHLQRLTNFGLREVMKHFARYSWMEGGPAHTQIRGAERLIHQYPVSLKVFILNEKRRFSQSYSRFPNIFLVNPEPSGQHRNPHTYWLKWLLLQTIVRRYKQQIPIYVDEILRLFSEPQGRDRYRHGIVGLCLGSLCEKNRSDAIDLKHDAASAGGDVQHGEIEPTRRGLHLMDGVWNRFWYLQQVVDDPVLPIPRVVFEEFKYQQGLDYAYFGLPENEYIEKAKTMVGAKAKQVLIFICVLRHALECEKRRYHVVFERLVSEESVNLPDIDAIEGDICKRIAALNDKLGCSIDVTKLRSSLMTVEQKIIRQLSEAYGA